MKKTYISPVAEWAGDCTEQELLQAASGTAIKNGNASEDIDVLSRKDNPNYSVWDDEE